MKDDTFNRAKAFTFYGEWAEDAKEIENDYGLATKANFYDAIINYALYEIEPELKPPVKYIWKTLKEKIDASQEHRSKGFREDTDMTDKIREYKQNNPEVSQRDIATAMNCSIGKVNKALKDITTRTSTITSTSTSTSTTMNVNVNTIENERNEKDLRDLTEEEMHDIFNEIINKSLNFKEIIQKYHLKSGFVFSNFKEQCDLELERRQTSYNKIFQELETYMGRSVNKELCDKYFNGYTPEYILEFLREHPIFSKDEFSKKKFPKGYYYPQYLLDGLNGVYIEEVSENISQVITKSQPATPMLTSESEGKFDLLEAFQEIYPS